ncbi:MAG: PTS lactose/cellobiose transporter subunit IIA [Enterocloster sp.]
MTEADYGPSFQIIAAAGDSKGYSMSAIKAAKAGNFEQAAADMKQASDLLLEAHEFQTSMIQQEASGNQVPVNIILVHSQDHLTMAMVAQDLSEQIVELYKELHEVKEELAQLKSGK